VLFEDVASGVSVRKDERTYIDVPCGRRSFMNFNPEIERLATPRDDKPVIPTEGTSGAWYAV